jgi:hypothetical protein
MCLLVISCSLRATVSAIRKGRGNLLTSSSPNRDAIAIAYVVRDESLFRRATEYALVHFTDEQLEEEIGGGLAGVLPSGLIGKSLSCFRELVVRKGNHKLITSCCANATETIKANRRNSLLQLERALHVPILAIHAKLLDPEEPLELHPIEPCELATEKLALYTLQLCHLKQGRFSLADDANDGVHGMGKVKGVSLWEVWEGCEEMEAVLPKDCRKCGKNCEGGCMVDVRKGLRDAVEMAKREIRGLCLGCVVEDKGECSGHGEDN